jgi:hypothetical protein
MKGTHFQRPTELVLNIHGEEWQQGDLLKGVFLVKNHGTEALDLENFGVTIAWGENRKVKAKADGCFKTVFQAKFPKTSVPAGQEKELAWEFQLPQDAPVTDKTGTLYALFGHTEQPWQGGNLLLTVKLPKLARDLLEMFENFLRFKVKEVKNKKKKIEVKFLVPASKDFAGVEGLTMDLSIVEKVLEMEFYFKVKKLAYTTEGVNLQGDKLKLDLVMKKAEYELAPDVIDQQKILPKLKQLFEAVKMKTLV